jgi:alcohol dehydrogenase (cytochrome c)
MKCVGLHFAAASVLISIEIPVAMWSQGASEQVLLHPPADSWPGYHGDYSGRRHSSLTQITPQNVKNLSLAWAFQTEQFAAIKSSPLLVDGILYFTVPDHIWAVDARSGHQIWHYDQPTTEGEHIGNRGVAMYRGYLFFMDPDAHLITLKAKDGTVRWKVTVGAVTKGY